MPGSKENDVCLFYNEADEDKANGIRSELEKLNMKVQSYGELIAGQSKLKSRTSLILNSWTVVLIVTDAFVDNGMNDYETEMTLMVKIEKEKRPMVVPVKYCNTSIFPSSLGVYNEIEGISRTGDLKAFDTIAKEIQRNVEYNKNQAAKTAQDNPLPDGARKMLKSTSKALIKYFEMDQKLIDLHKTLKEKMENNAAGGADRQARWIELINVNIKGDWKQGRSKGLYFEKNVSSTMKDKHPEVVDGLDGPKGYLCLAFLDDFNKCANLAEYLDPDAILELLKRCPVFPRWNDSQRKAFDDLKNDRIQDAHRSVSEPAEREQKLINSTADSALNVFEELLRSPFQAEIEELKGAPQAQNQSDAPEDQQDDTRRGSRTNIFGGLARWIQIFFREAFYRLFFPDTIIYIFNGERL
ncbi:uncharacterized protein LOC119731300 [Patiria miniata]|uniref:TIR domain-containing protein n=1 Tax=Patiria miniata TaxID=46514 RepID=A0A914A960_PATMI|nr:uncharacterized protein LOC119731300 [Patiria miniata]